MLLREALKARIPLISATTTDTVNITDVLTHLAGERVSKGKKNGYKIYWQLGDPSNAEFAYGELANSGETLVCINPEEKHSLMFDTGELPIPQELVLILINRIIDEGSAPAILNVLGGLTLKEIAEILRITSSKYHAITPERVVEIRRQVSAGIRGLQFVNVDNIGWYMPNDKLENWLEVEEQFFTKGAIDSRLIPRGLLLAGPPGTGKTLGAKWLAREMGVPMFRLDMAALMDKWLGESERLLREALSRVEKMTPCVLLVDEAEKCLSSDTENASSLRMLSTLLWWMQERTARVLVVMTTNNFDKIPGEIIRPGRIDRIITFDSMTRFEAEAFAIAMLSSFPLTGLPKSPKEFKADQQLWRDGPLTHAVVTERVLRYVKQHLANGGL